MRSSWMWVSPNSSGSHLYMMLKRIRRDTGKSHVKTEEEIGIMLSQTTGGEKLSGKYHVLYLLFFFFIASRYELQEDRKSCMSPV